MFLGWLGGDNAPHKLWAIVSNILVATIYFIIILLSFSRLGASIVSSQIKKDNIKRKPLGPG